MTDSPQARPRYGPLYALFAADLISVSGNMMAFIAIPWFVLQTTGSASKTGITAIAEAIPAVIAAFLGGVLVDRVGYRRTSIIADLLSAAAIAMIPLLYGTVGVAFGALLVLVFIGNLLDTPGGTARTALTPELAEMAGISLEKASALTDAISRGTRLIGAPLAGVLIALIGANNVLLIDAGTYLVSAMLVTLCIPRPTIKPAAVIAAPRHYIADLVEAVRFLRNDRLMLAIIGTVTITNLLDAAGGSVIMPVYVERVFGNATVLGLISGCTGGAALITALYISAKGISGSRRLIFAVSFMITGLRFWVLAVYPPLGLLLLAMVFIGLAIGTLNPIIGTVQFERVPPDMRARVFGVITAGAMIGTPLGGLSGLLLDRIGLQPTIILVGALYLLTTASLLINPAIRELDNKKAVAAPAATAETL